MLAGGLIGWFVWRVNIVERLLLIGGAILLIKPGIYTDIVGLIFLGIVIALQTVRKRKDAAASA
jgi:TRAP-type uncharacterized transport system fused permease subunit